MNDLSNIYVKENKEGLNPNLVFLVNEWPNWKILALQGLNTFRQDLFHCSLRYFYDEEYNGLTYLSP